MVTFLTNFTSYLFTDLSTHKQAGYASPVKVSKNIRNTCK
jgi:hypothetical protein